MSKNLINRDISEIQTDNMLAYSFSVICGRAIPDYRDGLKPVQKRILWGMLKDGSLSSKPHKKSAKVVGNIMGR